jgi:RNA polymerase sigma-32 factor
MTNIGSGIARLSPEEERDLVLRWRNDQDISARDRLVTAHLDMVRGAIGRVRGADISRDDLFQDGVLGLFKAVDRFDPDEGTRFGTYAAFWVRAEVQTSLGAGSGPVRIPRSHEGTRVATWYSRARSRLEADIATGRSPEPEDGVERETARRMGICPDRISALLSLVNGRSVPVITQESGEWEEGEGHQLISHLTPEHILANQERQEFFRQAIKEACDALSPREREVILRRYLTDEPETFQSIADAFGLTRERIRQIEVKALRVIRRKLCEKRGIRWLLVDPST